MSTFSFRIGRKQFDAFKAFSKSAQRLSGYEVYQALTSQEAEWHFEFFQLAATLGDEKSIKATLENISIDDTLREMARVDLILRKRKTLPAGYSFAAKNEADNQFLTEILKYPITTTTKNLAAVADSRLWGFALRLAASEMIPVRLADILNILPSETAKTSVFQHLKDLITLKADFGNVSLYRADAEMIVKMCTAWLDPACQPYNADNDLVKISLSRGLIRIGDIEAAHSTVLSVSTKKAELVRASTLIQTCILLKKIPEAIAHASRTIQLLARSPHTIEKDAGFNPKNAERALIRVNKLLRAAGLKPFVMSGTLLGMIREGHIFPHDKDFDIGLIGWESQYDVAQALLLDGNYTFDVHDLKGHHTFMLMVVDKISNMAFDIFFYHDKGHYFLHGIDNRYGYTQNFQFSKFNLIEKEFMGHNFYLPENFEINLSENYGPNWQVPEPNYFVKIESPAIAIKSGLMFTLVAYLEMISVMKSAKSRTKGDALLNRILSTMRPEDHPKLADINAYKKYFSRLTTDLRIVG